MCPLLPALFSSIFHLLRTLSSRSTLVSRFSSSLLSLHTRKSRADQVRAQLVLFCQAGPSLLARDMPSLPRLFLFPVRTAKM